MARLHMLRSPIVRFPRVRSLIALVLAGMPVAAHADERSYMLTDFDRIRVEGPFTVRVTTGPGARGRAVGEQRALDEVNVRVLNRTLVVTRGVNGWGGFPRDAKTVPTIDVSVPMLRSAAVFGDGALTVDRMAGQRIELAVSGAGALSVGAIAADRVDGMLIGSGTMTIAGRALDARFRSSGSGALDASALSAGALTVVAQGSGAARFAARETAKVTATGQGSVRVAGTPACTVSGTAHVECGAPSRP